MLRQWRERRHLSQMQLALDARISTRHLSFVETGRSHPGRELLLRLLDALAVPAREQNHLLLTAGHAPAFPERALDHPDLRPLQRALHLILERHEPYPAIIVDRHWNLRAANRAIASLAGGVDVDPVLLEPPVNAIRVGLHPQGLAPRLVNPRDWQRHFGERLRRQAETTADPQLAALAEEVAGYVYTGEQGDERSSSADILGPLKIREPGGATLAFFGMFATFDTPFEVNASELAVELLFPADEATADALQGAAGR